MAAWDAKQDQQSSKIPCYPNDFRLQDAFVLPSWFDRDRFNESKTIVKRHFFSILFSHLSGLTLLVFIKSIHRTLSTSGKSNNLVSLFYRYASTLLTIKSWYEDDVFDPQCKAHQSMQRVKQMHYNTASLQNKHLQVDKDELSISMRDMILTQFAFVGLIVLHPREMGFSTRDEDITKLVYFWRTIAALLGMPDKYNLCDGDNLDQVRRRCRQVFELNYRARLEAMNEEGARMSCDIIYTAQQYIFTLRYNSLMRYLCEVLHIQHSFRCTTFLERFTYTGMRNVMSHWIHYRLVAFMLNTIVRLSVYQLFITFIVQNIVKRLSESSRHKH